MIKEEQQFSKLYFFVLVDILRILTCYLQVFLQYYVTLLNDWNEW